MKPSHATTSYYLDIEWFLQGSFVKADWVGVCTCSRWWPSQSFLHHCVTLLWELFGIVFLLWLESSFGNRHGMNPSGLAEAMSVYARVTNDWDGVDNSSLTARANDQPSLNSHCVCTLKNAPRKIMDHSNWLADSLAVPRTTSARFVIRPKTGKIASWKAVVGPQRTLSLDAFPSMGGEHALAEFTSPPRAFEDDRSPDQAEPGSWNRWNRWNQWNLGSGTLVGKCFLGSTDPSGQVACAQKVSWKLDDQICSFHDFSGHSYWVLYFEVNRLVMIRGFWMIVLQNQGNQVVKLLFKALNIPRLAPLEARSDPWKDEAIRARDFLGIEMHHNLYDDFESSQREREKKKILADPLYPAFFVQWKGPTNQCWQFAPCAIRVLLVCALLPGKSPGVLHIHHCRQGESGRCKAM